LFSLEAGAQARGIGLMPRPVDSPMPAPEAIVRRIAYTAIDSGHHQANPPAQRVFSVDGGGSMAELKLFPTSDIDFEVIHNGQMVAMRSRSEAGEPSHVVVPVDLLKKIYAHIPTVLGIAKEAREKAGIAHAESKVTLPQIHDLTRVEFGLLENEPDKVCLLFELHHVMTLPTKANRVWIKNAIKFIQDKLAETEPKPT